MKTYHRIVQIDGKKILFLNVNLPPYSANSGKKAIFT
eukprot:UN05097